MKTPGSELAGADVSGILARPLTKNNREGHLQITGKCIAETGNVIPQTSMQNYRFNSAPVAAILRHSTRRGKHGGPMVISAISPSLTLNPGGALLRPMPPLTVEPMLVLVSLSETG